MPDEFSELLAQTTTGVMVETKAHGLPRHAANKGKCTLTLTSLAAEAVSGTLACTALTDMAATGTGPEVTNVKFESRLAGK